MNVRSFSQLSIKDTSQQNQIKESDLDTLVEDLSSLVGNGEFADYKFLVDGHEIPAHKAILSSKY
jgi:hypothetical protein